MAHRWSCTLRPGHDGPCKPARWRMPGLAKVLIVITLAIVSWAAVIGVAMFLWGLIA